MNPAGIPSEEKAADLQPQDSSSEERGAGFWAWPVILLATVVIGFGPLIFPQAQQASVEDAQRSQLALLQLQARVAIGVAPLNPAQAATELEQLESWATTDRNAAALALVHAFISPDEKGRGKAAEILEQRKEAAGSAPVFLSRIRRGIDNGVSEEERGRFRRELGWFSQLFAEKGTPEKFPNGDAIRAQGLIMALSIGVLALVAFVAFLTGCVLAVLALVNRRQGKLSFAFSFGARPARVFLESFAIFLAGMALSNLGAWMVHWLFQPVGMGLTVILALWWPVCRGWRWREVRRSLGWHRGRGFFREIGAGFVGYLGMLPIVGAGILCTLLLSLAMGAIHAQEAGDAIGAAPDPVTHPVVGLMLGGLRAKVFVLVLGAVLAPLLEETFFRGAFFRALRSRWGLVFSGLLSGLIFAALHPQGVVAIPALTAMGFGFACIREWRDSLIAPMTAHAINNGLLIGMLAMALQ